jgi:hypothetical protein
VPIAGAADELAFAEVGALDGAVLGGSLIGAPSTVDGLGLVAECDVGGELQVLVGVGDAR